MICSVVHRFLGMTPSFTIPRSYPKIRPGCVLGGQAIGRGTPSPTHPTETLVVQGLHRYLRNPMYLGEALWLQSGLLLLYTAAILAAFNAFIRLYEEPTLRRTYGDEYIRYCQTTPRWLPRLGKR